MEDRAVVPERIFDAACGGGVAEVEEWLTSAAAPRDVDQSNGITALLSCATFSTPFDQRAPQKRSQLRGLLERGARPVADLPRGSASWQAWLVTCTTVSVLGQCYVHKGA